MGWDELIADWDRSLVDIERAVAAGDWQSLEGLEWPEPDDSLAPPNPDQRRRVVDLTERQSVAAAAISDLLERVGRELREAETLRGAVNAYEASRRPPGRRATA